MLNGKKQKVPEEIQPIPERIEEIGEDMEAPKEDIKIDKQAVEEADKMLTDILNNLSNRIGKIEHFLRLDF